MQIQLYLKLVIHPSKVKGPHESPSVVIKTGMEGFKIRDEN